VGRLSRVAWLYIGIVVAAAVVMIAVGPFGGLDWVQVGALGLLLVACESSATLVNPRGLSWSANSIASLAAVVLCGPVGAALVGCCTLFGVRRSPSPPQRAFNAAMFTVSAYLAGRTFLLFGGHVGVPVPSSFPGVIGPFAAAAIVHVTVNFALVRGVFWLTREPGTALGRLGLDLKLWLTDVGYGAFGLLIAALWSVLGPFAPVLVLVPVFVARWAVAQFAAQQRAYEATVSALCQAVETKDFYTRGHSERVSKGAARRKDALFALTTIKRIGGLLLPTSFSCSSKL